MGLLQPNADWLGCVELQKLLLGVIELRLRASFFVLLP